MDERSSVSVSWRTVLVVLLILLAGAVVGHGLLRSTGVSAPGLADGQETPCDGCPSQGACQVDADPGAYQVACAAGGEQSGCAASQSGCPLADSACGVQAGCCGVEATECAGEPSDVAPACCGSACPE